MTDQRDEQEPITGSDPTNGLAGDLEGDDGGAVEPERKESVFQEVIGDLADGGRRDDDTDSTTPYSEEGKP
ncbi:hypothetical protein [Leifsonia sp. C5G2]|uniref:hypothetical protein n=1 Tax=Leifsonia sp. C5G2 TaxID=2735269 RepID=UPI001585A5B1|nr:hypothetical protein [Leifsonia sp. C5G2]NUU06323.1 hypothetical protein [Leifsonia sp. C5G2]